MIKTGHPTEVTAKQELTAHGFQPGFSSPTRPQLWCKSKDKRRRYAVASIERARSVEWRIVPYPEPAVLSPDECEKRLAEETGALLPEYDRSNGTALPG